MRPAYWIALGAAVGGALGYAISRDGGWMDAGAGIVVGILIGALLFGRPKPKGPRPSR